MFKKPFFFVLLLLISACHSSDQTKINLDHFSKTVRLIDDKTPDSVVFEKLKNGTSGDYIKLGTLSDSLSLLKIKNSLNNAEAKMIKFIPLYKIIVFCSDTIIDIGYTKPNIIISYGSSLIVDKELEKMINKFENAYPQVSPR